MMYFESSYPNFVYAIDLDSYWRIVWKFAPEQDKFSPSVACCDLVNNGVAYADGKIFATTLDTHLYALDAKTGKVLWSAQERRSEAGPDHDLGSAGGQDKVIVGISGGEYGVRGYLTAYDLNTGKLVWRANSVGPDEDILFDPAKTIDGATQQPVGTEFQPQNLDQRRVEARRRHHVGLVHLRSPAQPGLLRDRQPGHVESRPAARRQQVVDDHLRPQSGYGSGRVGVSDDASRRLGLRRHQRERAHRQRQSMARPFRPSRISIATASPTCSTAATASFSRRANSIRP